MADYILIVTPTQAFGEMIRRTLEATKRFRVIVADSGGEALGEIQQKPFVVCILDYDLTDVPFSDLVRALRKLRPTLRLVIIPPDGADQANWDNLTGDKALGEQMLSRSFDASDLLDVISQALASPALPTPTQKPLTVMPSIPSNLPQHPTLQDAAPQEAVSPVWLDDVTRAAQHLARLSLATAAQAALIVRERQLWAYAGQLPQLAAQELAVVVASYWTRSGDLTRFVHLTATGGEHMLYATRLSGNMILALVFDNQIPFTKIRPQAMQLARALASSPRPGEATLPIELESSLPTRQDSENSSAAPGLEAQNLPPLLDDVPPPNPLRVGQKSRQIAGFKPFSLPPDTDLAADEPVTPRHISNAAPTPFPTLSQEDELHRRDADLPEAPHPAPPGETGSPALQPVAGQGASVRWESMQTRQDAPPRPELVPASPILVNLCYACILIPRMPHHHINGDLEIRLAEWIPHVCLAYGWRLEQLTIQPDYLQWIVNVSPITSPSYLMRIFRQRTSQSIFSEFPGLSRENPSGDFWAPGYLIMSSTQPPPPQIVTDFIRQTRLYQGASRPLPR